MANTLAGAGAKRTSDFYGSEIHKGRFHAWLGKKAGEPITDADIAKGMASNDPHVRKMANFAKNARSFKH